MAYGLQTYDDASRKESILDVLTDATPKSTPLMTLFSTAKTTATLDEWPEDYQARSTDTTGDIEGEDFTFADLVEPSRRNNITQVIKKPIKVSGTEAVVRVAGVDDPYAYQKAKAFTGLKLKWENVILNSSAKASGSSGVARTMAGIVGIVSSHFTRRNSGTSISVQEINDIVNDVFTDVGIENMFNLIVVPMGLKQKISTLSTNLTRYEEATSRRLTFPVQVWESDAGEHRIIPHQDMNNSAGTVHLLALREEAWQVAYLREPFFKQVASQGDNEKGGWISEGTLRFLGERTNAKRTGYAQAG